MEESDSLVLIILARGCGMVQHWKRTEGAVSPEAGTTTRNTHKQKLNTRRKESVTVSRCGEPFWMDTSPPVVVSRTQEPFFLAEIDHPIHGENSTCRAGAATMAAKTTQNV